MKTGPSVAQAGSDRFSTLDEIRAALFCLPDFMMEPSSHGAWEVDSDLGGRVRVEMEEVEFLTLLERLDTTEN